MIASPKLAVLAILAWGGLASASGAAAQEFPIEPQPVPQSQEEGLREVGRTAEIGGTRVGERQAADRAVTGISPTARLQNRIPGRLENRLRTRLDENFNASADPAASLREFEQARERSRGQRPRQ